NAISWVLSPLLGGIIAYLLFGMIQRHILLYNEKAENKLRQLSAERIAHRDQHRREFDRLTEIQQVAYTSKLLRDSELAKMPDVGPTQLESDYYKQLQKID